MRVRRMLSVPKNRAYSLVAAANYRRAAQITAAGVTAFALAATAVAARGGQLFGLELHTSLALLASGAAILLLVPDLEARPNRHWVLGYAVAAAVLALGVANGKVWMKLPGLEPQSVLWAVCFGILGVSLLGKAVLPSIGVALDVFVAFVASIVILEAAFGLPMDSKIQAAAGIGVFALAAAWLMAFPRFRPMGFYTEKGPAGLVLRRVLPISLVFPFLLVALSYMQRHTHGALAKSGSWILILSTVGFGVGLLAIIASTLDRQDQRRVASEHDLRESEAQVRALLESTVEGIYAVDLEGNCIWCNPAALRALGIPTSDQFLGRKVHELIHHTRGDGSPYPAAECEMMRATMAGRRFAQDEEMLWRPDGSCFPADCRSSPLLRDGQCVGAVVSFADVSERKSLQAQFQQAQKMEAIGRLAAGIAHDFNNLLTVINGYTEMLTRRNLEPEIQGKIGNIRKAGERAAGLTQQLLAFSRQQVLQPKVLDLNEVLAEMDPLLRRVLGEDLALETHLAADLAPVRADPGQISQVLMNLVVNARDAMPEGGCLTIESANVTLDAHYAASHPEVTPGQYVMLAVTDQGSGMDAATLAHLFEPFFTTKGVGKGTGLGLATVFGIVKQSGGSIAAYSELGHGTAMKVYLPSCGRANLGTETTAGDEALPGGRETILVVEDEDIVRDLLQEVLETSGYTVLMANAPAQAIALSERHAGEIHLLVTDVVMPGMDGRRLAALLVAQRPQLEVLFISGYPDKAISHNGDLESGLSFIQKPFTPDALVQKVRAVLDSHLPPQKQSAHA